MASVKVERSETKYLKNNELLNELKAIWLKMEEIRDKYDIENDSLLTLSSYVSGNSEMYDIRSFDITICYGKDNKLEKYRICTENNERVEEEVTTNSIMEEG